MIKKWHDREIKPGQDWSDQIDKRLRRAQIILLFISPHFIESDYCYEVEMREALERQKTGEAEVIPVILRPCLWRSAPFGHLQALPQDGTPITSWPNRDEACVNVAQGIMDVVQQIIAEKRTQQLEPEFDVPALLEMNVEQIKKALGSPKFEFNPTAEQLSMDSRITATLEYQKGTTTLQIDHTGGVVVEIFISDGSEGRSAKDIFRLGNLDANSNEYKTRIQNWVKPAEARRNKEAEIAGVRVEK